ncbi:MAG: hypothetical protein KAS96_03515 [Planctomycetes bacterium]|nr:hypothetical protein [Planctomycetota bacterium]
MISQVKQILPRKGFILLLAFFYVIIYLFEGFFYYRFQITEFPEFDLFQFTILIIASIFYGIYRAVYFNPYIRTNYRQWLALTPWSPDKSLPLGPLHLIWADLIPIGFLTILCYFNGPFYILWPAITFLAAYLLCLCVGIAEEQFYLIIVFLFLAPFIIYPHKDPRLTFVVLIALYLFFYFTLKQQFKNFPWNTDFWKFDLVKTLKKQAFDSLLIGWPMRNFAPSKINCDFGSGVLIGLLITWWQHIFRWCMQDQYDLSLLIIYSTLICILRMVIYITGHPSPISWVGRISTFRFIIPNYDKVFIAPICIFLVCLLIFFLNPWVNRTLLFESGLFLILLLAFTLPPTRQKWQLTAPCRITSLVKRHNNTPPTKDTQAFKKITSGSFSLFPK